MSERAHKSNRFASDIFVSIHCNAFTNDKAQGVETFYYKTNSKGKVLASKFQTSIINKKIYTRNRGIKPGNFYVLRRTSAMAVLLELGFITNATDRCILLSNKEEFARAVVEAVKGYLG